MVLFTARYHEYNDNEINKDDKKFPFDYEKISFHSKKVTLKDYDEFKSFDDFVMKYCKTKLKKVIDILKNSFLSRYAYTVDIHYIRGCELCDYISIRVGLGQESPFNYEYIHL